MDFGYQTTYKTKYMTDFVLWFGSCPFLVILHRLRRWSEPIKVYKGILPRSKTLSMSTSDKQTSPYDEE